MLVINLKTYKDSMGAPGLRLLRTIDEAAQNAPVDVLVAVNALDVEAAAKSASHVKIIAQHADANGYGAHTGKIPPEELKNRGAVGTLLNHSENRISDDILGDAIDLARAHFPQFTIVCTPSFEHASKIESKWDPSLVAYEPPELIGGDISVSNSKPEIIQKVVGISPDRQILVGAGVKTLEDVRSSLDLGAIGILVASGVVKAEDPAAVVRSFLSAWA